MYVGHGTVVRGFRCTELPNDAYAPSREKFFHHCDSYFAQRDTYMRVGVSKR